MRALLASLALALSLVCTPGHALAQDDNLRVTIDALVEFVSTSGDAAVADFADQGLAPAYVDRLGRDAALSLLHDVREAARGTLGMIDVGVDDGRFVLRLSAERSAELGLQIDSDGMLTHLEIMSTSDAPAPAPTGMEAAVEQRMLAIEDLPMRGTEGFAEENFTSELRAELEPSRLAEMLEQARDAAASAGAISAEPAADGYLLSFRGGRTNVDVFFALEAAEPYRISRFDVVLNDGADDAPPFRPIGWTDLESRLEEAHAAGMSGTVLAIRGGRTVLDRSFGFADRSTSRDNDASTIYAIGSIPIDFTRAGILLLAQRGEIQLDDRLSRHFQDVPDDKVELTVRHLLEHESGLPNFHHRAAEDADFDLTWIDREEAERRILGAELLFEPGSERLPSHSAFGLLAALIERVSGQPYQDFMRTNFFEPLGMEVTGPFGEDFGQSLTRFATGYGSSSVGEPNVPPHWGPTSWLIQGSGGMVSNPSDMRRWFDGLRGGRILEGPMLERYLDRGSALGASDRGFFFGHFWAGGDDMVFVAINDGGDSDEVGELIRALSALVRGNGVTDQ